MLLYIDPSTGPVIFTGLTALLAAVGGGLLVFLSLLFRPVRMFFCSVWRLVTGKKQPDEQADENGEA